MVGVSTFAEVADSIFADSIFADSIFAEAARSGRGWNEVTTWTRYEAPAAMITADTSSLKERDIVLIVPDWA